MSAPDRIWVMFGRRGELEPAVNPGEKPADEVLSHFFEYTRATSESDALREENAILRTEKHADAEAIAALREALRDVIVMLDDPTGNEQVRDMRGATVIARAALKGDA